MSNVLNYDYFVPNIVPILCNFKNCRYAASVHNLPVMSQALALGADRDWINIQSPTSSPVIHQSIKR